VEAHIKPTTGERGYVNYDLHQGVEDPAVFFFYENWEAVEDLDAPAAPGKPSWCQWTITRTRPSTRA